MFKRILASVAALAVAATLGACDAVQNGTPGAPPTDGWTHVTYDPNPNPVVDLTPLPNDGPFGVEFELAIQDSMGEPYHYYADVINYQAETRDGVAIDKLSGKVFPLNYVGRTGQTELPRRDIISFDEPTIILIATMTITAPPGSQVWCIAREKKTLVTLQKVVVHNDTPSTRSLTVSCQG